VRSDFGVRRRSSSPILHSTIGLGADTMISGTGNDTYFVDNAGDTVTENPGEGTDTIDRSISRRTWRT
jgi:Ca2+-binding RTX toxin-like protein